VGKNRSARLSRSRKKEEKGKRIEFFPRLQITAKIRATKRVVEIDLPLKNGKIALLLATNRGCVVKCVSQK